MELDWPKLFPARLRSGLAQLGEALAAGRVPQDLLEQVLGDLGALPPQSVGQADAQIAGLAGLFRFRPAKRRMSLLNLLRPSQSDLDLLERDPRLAGLFIFHRDGFVREAALAALRDPPTNPFLFAALVWRLNDWVRPVRLTARLVADRLFPATSPEVVVAAAPLLLDRWLHWRRWEQENADLVDALLDRSDVAAALAENFKSSSVGALATQLRFAMRTPRLDEYLLTLARQAVQPSVRATALRALVRGEAAWPVGFDREWIDKRYGLSCRITRFERRVLTAQEEPDALIMEGIRDGSSTVRRVAADGLIQRRDSFPRLAEALEMLGRDSSPAIRERVAFLRKSQTEQTAG
jgi:hypothetical protein